MSGEPPPFQEASRCDVCHCSFTTFRRRHHCRCCGKTLCSEHSSYQMTLPQFGIHTNVRVCYECFNKASSTVKSGSIDPSEGIIPATDGISKLTLHEDKSSSHAPTSENNTATTVTDCKCGMPLCICEAPKAAPIPIQVQSATASTVQSNPKPKRTAEPGARKSAASSSNSSSSFFNLSQTNNSSIEKKCANYDVTGEGLREAIKNGDATAVRKLLSQGVDPNYCDKQGFTVLHLAALFNQTEIALILVDHGANVEVKNPQGESAMDCAPTMLQYKLRERIREIAVGQSGK
ncbi:hypothetical protein LUZ62_042033 [Rhynchospora pubera]|uniref:FYVE-type domain-containing protein n=1 Tax=Rhynchospora pubera TaxID=906938 RepID=A0AAV8FKM1_9POAL|nr:hypothetical protein LUZ62_090599 [Rhynchospora pubera]KAJ4790787.1 hypothetical protein LUZ62_042033 [Rhynchospora pubera]